MSGYSGTYRGLVVDNVDPAGQDRLSVTVPDVGGTPMWAAPSDPSQVGQLPSVGDGVQVTFESGDADHPVWQSSSAAPASSGGGGGGGYGGVYQATVVDNVDPGQGARLQVSVPDVLGESPAWASPSASGGSSVPDIGSTVSVQFEGGDPEHPVWSDGS